MQKDRSRKTKQKPTRRSYLTLGMAKTGCDSGMQDVLGVKACGWATPFGERGGRTTS